MKTTKKKSFIFRIRTAVWIATFLIAPAMLSGNQARAGEQDAPDFLPEVIPQGCRPVEGLFMAQSPPQSECASPVGICTRGNLYGALSGSYEMTMNRNR